MPSLEREAYRLRSLIDDADAIIVGIGSGMSSAAGFNHYNRAGMARAGMTDWQQAFGFKSLFDGFYHLYPSLEQQWAYYARYIDFMLRELASQPYLDLRSLIGHKDYFILSTNVDTQAEKTFPDERTCNYQGSFAHLQCKQPCCDELFDASPYVERMLAGMAGFDAIVPVGPEIPIKECDTRFQRYLFRFPANRFMMLITGIQQARREKSETVLFRFQCRRQQTLPVTLDTAFALCCYAIQCFNPFCRCLRFACQHKWIVQFFGCKLCTSTSELILLFRMDIGIEKKGRHLKSLLSQMHNRHQRTGATANMQENRIFTHVFTDPEFNRQYYSTRTR